MLRGTHSELNDTALHPAQTYPVLTMPPYAAPLNSATNASQWWQAHRPLLLLTAALGPIDPRQRYGDELPDPTFQGFRLMVVRENAIKKNHYITIDEMRTANFVLPFEAQDTHPKPVIPLVPINPVLELPLTPAGVYAILTSIRDSNPSEIKCLTSIQL